MAFTTVPTPLWSCTRSATGSRRSRSRLRLPSTRSVALSLFFVGHLSDSYGRRRVLMPALAMEILAALVFVAWSSLPALLVARVLSGLASAR